jgi:hypothetical protein
MIMTGNDDETLICQRVGATFRIQYQVPLRADRAPTSAPDTHAAFPYHVETPVSVASGLEDVQRLLTTDALGGDNRLRNDPTDPDSPAEPDGDNQWILNFEWPGDIT